MSSGASSSNTSDHYQAVMGLPGEPSSGMQRTACGVSTSFYYNQHRCHTGLGGATPAERSSVPAQPIVKLECHVPGGNITMAYSRPHLLLNWNSTRTGRK